MGKSKKIFDGEKHKSFSLRTKHGIKGEAFFESLIVEFALPNHIVGSKDLGLDYFCEWVHGDNPTGILFAVQIKTFEIGKKIKPKLIKTLSDNNWLEQYRIVNTHFRINPETLNYWKRLGIPIYLFAVTLDDKTNGNDCYYKRFTPILTEDNLALGSYDPYSEFYKVNDNNRFLAFKHNEKRVGGFTRDLFIDYIRCNYYKGTITYLNPRDIGLNQFPEKDAVFGELVEKYRNKISSTYSSIKSFMEKYPGILLNLDINSSCPGTATSYATEMPPDYDDEYN